MRRGKPQHIWKRNSDTPARLKTCGRRDSTEAQNHCQLRIWSCICWNNIWSRRLLLGTHEPEIHGKEDKNYEAKCALWDETSLRVGNYTQPIMFASWFPIAGLSFLNRIGIFLDNISQALEPGQCWTNITRTNPHAIQERKACYGKPRGQESMKRVTRICKAKCELLGGKSRCMWESTLQATMFTLQM